MQTILNNNGRTIGYVDNPDELPNNWVAMVCGYQSKWVSSQQAAISCVHQLDKQNHSLFYNKHQGQYYHAD